MNCSLVNSYVYYKIIRFFLCACQDFGNCGSGQLNTKKFWCQKLRIQKRAPFRSLNVKALYSLTNILYFDISMQTTFPFKFIGEFIVYRGHSITQDWKLMVNYRGAGVSFKGNRQGHYFFFFFTTIQKTNTCK